MFEQDRAFKSSGMVRFLEHALGPQIPDKRLTSWDGSLIHCSKTVKRFLSDGAASSRLHLEQLPGYAPQLNPDEGILKHLKKHAELKNICCRSVSKLRVELRKAKEHLRHKKHVIFGYIRQLGVVF
jgi:transposase